MTSAAGVVMLIASLGWLAINWRSHRSSAAQAGWSGQTQLQMAFVWLIVIAGLTVLVQRFGS